MGIPDYPFDARHFRKFRGRPLRITSGDQDSRFRVLAVNAANRGPRVGVRFSRHRAGVQDDKIGIAPVGRAVEPAFGQLRFERGSIRLGGAASEILDMKTH